MIDELWSTHTEQIKTPTHRTAAEFEPMTERSQRVLKTALTLAPLSQTLLSYDNPYQVWQLDKKRSINATGSISFACC